MGSMGTSRWTGVAVPMGWQRYEIIRSLAAAESDLCR